MPAGYTFVLVHGAWHDGAHWTPVATRLREAGHCVHAPTLAGFGHDADLTATHADGTASIMDYLERHQLDDIVLVGHSLGGTFISKVAEAVPERIRRLVYLCAFVVADGNSVLDECPPGVDGPTDVDPATGTTMVPWSVWREVFINDADEATARAVYDTLSPTPFAILGAKLDLAKFYELVGAGRLRCSYLNCTDDIVMPHGRYAWHPRFSSRLGRYRLVQMPGSHEVMLTNPSGLAQKIIEAGRD